ncbi:hypothetical protein C0J52_22954 [Blattella germanica]|nr:hypothetical protein C0J52_22954 [Blattella germanica]
MQANEETTNEEDSISESKTDIWSVIGTNSNRSDEEAKSCWSWFTKLFKKPFEDCRPKNITYPPLSTFTLRVSSLFRVHPPSKAALTNHAPVQKLSHSQIKLFDIHRKGHINLYRPVSVVPVSPTENKNTAQNQGVVAKFPFIGAS